MTNFSRKVLALVGDHPPITLEEFRSRLWVLAPIGNEENSFIHTCRTIGSRDFSGTLITFDMIVDKRARYVRSMVQKGKDQVKWIKGLDRWLQDGGMNEQYSLSSDKLKSRYGI